MNCNTCKESCPANAFSGGKYINSKCYIYLDFHR